MNRSTPRLWRRFTIGMTLYVLVVILQSTFLRDVQVPRYVLIPLALLPLVPAVWGMIGWLQAVRTFDELQRRIQSEAGLFTLGMVLVASLGYGLLEAYAGFPRPSAFVVLPFVAINYLGGIARAKRRYG